MFSRVIPGFHSGEYEDDCLVVCAGGDVQVAPEEQRQPKIYSSAKVSSVILPVMCSLLIFSSCKLLESFKIPSSSGVITYERRSVKLIGVSLALTQASLGRIPQRKFEDQ